MNVSTKVFPVECFRVENSWRSHFALTKSVIFSGSSKTFLFSCGETETVHPAGTQRDRVRRRLGTTTRR